MPEVQQYEMVAKWAGPIGVVAVAFLTVIMALLKSAARREREHDAAMESLRVDMTKRMELVAADYRLIISANTQAITALNGSTQSMERTIQENSRLLARIEATKEPVDVGRLYETLQDLRSIVLARAANAAGG